MSDNIKVVVKVRPLISREIESKLSDQWRVINNTISLKDSYERSGHSFTFDKIYDKDTRTSDVYNDIAKPIVEAALAGFNGTIFAYGQTSSGKTYTMTGTEDAPGIIPLAVVNLFDCIKEIPDREFLVRASYVEIYNETLIDLLDIKKTIKISETYNSGVKVDATERLTTSPDEILKVMQEGKVNRQMGSTNMNEESSRSHSIFQITIESREHIEGGQEAGSVNVSQLNLVDLAGSERAGQTGATGIRFKEGTHINKSLSALALVIKQLSEDPNKHVNYRDSKLTRILQNSLGGNAKTGIICAVTPATVEETISTLQFASRAKSIKNSPAVNIVATDATMIQNLTKQLSTLKTQLEGKKNVEQDNHNLQNKIARLQSLILNGFVQRSNADMLCGTRRKLNPPRRVTISTLHPIEEDPLPVIATIPKFCTPSLKYNPMSLPSASEFLPIQKTQSLSCVTEEPRLVTPPPRDKKVNFSDEVIEIDSDDDSLNIQPCSPYHKCFESSKTPPCILRKNAKLAEKNLKDIVELTEREKLFKPNVVELMEQLETKVSIITKLEDDVNKLRNMSSEKDIELEKMRSNIEKVKQEISSVTSSKENLEDCIKSYETKLTDLEVSYELLKNKARIREEELLSLLHNHSIKKTFESTGTNTSVVNIENEKNTRNTEQEESLLSDVQAQLLMKEETIEELEKRLSDQTNTINILERSNREFKEMLEIHQNNIDTLEKEHSSQANTIKDLHVVIEDQKTLIDSINDNVNSLNNMVQDLQLKLSDKDKILKEFIVDVDVEDIFANEEIMAASNDNLKNIVHSLKINIQNKKEELNKIKSKAEKSSSSDNDDVLNELENSRKKIISLTEEITNLKMKYNDNNSDVDQFSGVEKNVVAIEQDLNKKISEILEEKSTLEKQNEMYRLEIVELKECKDLLNIKLAGSGQDTEHLKHQLELLNKKNMSLESDIENKSKQIIHLEEQHRNTQINLDKINIFAKKLQVITNLLSGNLSVPEIMDDLVVDFTDFSDNMQSLESVSTEILKQKNDMLTLIEKQISEILEEKSTLEKQNEMYRLEILELKECNDLLNIKLAGSGQDIEHLKHQLELLNKKNMSLESDIENKSKEIIHLEEQHRHTQINLDKMNIFAKKLQVITNLLSGHMSVPEIMDDLVADFTDFSDNMQSLENASTEILKQKNDMLTLIEKQVSEMDKYKLIINDYDKNVSEFCCECKTILEINNYKENNHCEESKELCLNNDANNGCDNVKYNFKNLINLIKTTKSQMSQLLEARDVEIKDLITANTNKDSKIKEVLTQVSELDDMVKKRDKIFNNILQKCLDLTLEFSIENNVSCEFGSESENTFENIILILDKISNYINILNASKTDDSDNTNATIVEAKTKIVYLTQENLELLNTIRNLEDDKNNLLKKFKEILIKNQDFASDLRKSKDLIYSFKCDVESNMTEFKYGFNNLNEALKEYMEKMKTENSDLLLEISKTRSDTDLSHSKLIITDNNHDIKNDPHVQLHSPPRLSTICCKTVIEAIDAARESDTSEKSIYESSSLDSAVLENVCHHEQILSELEDLRKDNTYLKHKNEELQFQNEDFMKEHEMLLKEVRLLIESSHDLQKKVVNHRTNLSTLMATTYAENKSLTSQIKFLQHYYSRFYNVCQKDIPDFKKQLQDLLLLLRSENFAKHNESFKRYSLPNTLDSTSIHTTFRNESILDGDLLMLDTNVSLTTCDNTLLGPDQTGLEVTQIYLCNEVACQTNDSVIVSNDTLHPQVIIDDPTYTTQKINESLDSLKEENDKLRKLVDEYNSTNSKSSESNNIAPTTLTVQPHCMDEGASECTHAQELRAVKIEYAEKYNNISEKLIDLESQKADIELKYNKLNLDVPNIDALTRKLNAFEKEMQTKQCSIDKLTSTLNDTKKEMAKLEVENDDLSNQIMDYVSEIDNLKEEHKLLSNVKTELANKCSDLEKNIHLLHSSNNMDKHLECLECKVKDQVIGDLKDRLTTDSCTRLNRSYSDSESSSRYNKFCTLQNELHAGREDCIELKEDVTTIKNHLEGSPNHQAMDLDISMGEPHLLTLNEDITGDKANNKNILDDTKQYQIDIYNLERVNCFNYYIEKIEGVESIPDPNVKIIDIMKMFYENMLLKHSNEVENLRNRLRDYEEGQHLLENQVASLNLEKTKISNDLKNKDSYLQFMAELMLSLKNNLNLIKGACNQPDIELQFKESFLHKIDKEFGLESLAVFETVVNFIHNEHSQESQRLEQKNRGLLDEAQNIRDELSNVNKDVSVLQSTLAQRESEYNLLCQQKERIHEVSNAVTLDIISKDRELREIIKNAYKKLSELNILDNKELDFNLPLNEIVKLLFEYTFSYYKEINIQENINQEKHNLMEELSNAKNILSEKEKQLESLKNQKDLIERNTSEMQQKMQQQINLHTDLMEIYEKKVEENASNVMMVNKLTEEVDVLKERISKKEMIIKELENKLDNEAKQTELESLAKLSEVLQSLKEAHEKIEELKIINKKVIQEKETLEKELAEAGKTIAQNKIELDKVNTDIMILKESVREYTDVVEKLKSETKILAEKKAELHNELQEKCNECSQLQVNIKTHEKTAEIQSKMIIKTRKQKEDAERSSREKDVKLEELSVKCKELQEECDQLAADMRTTREEMDSIRSGKDALEARVSELQAELEDRRGRMSIGSLADGSRRRRQSIYDAKRMCNDVEDEKRLEEMFKTHTPAEDMFMDVDNCSSNRSTPMRSSRGRDSISSKHDQSEEEAGARVRSRRRSVHDRVRRLSTDQNHVSSPDSTENTSANSELQELRKRLSSCEEELSELRDRYRELDEECETCAQYLRSSEEQCKRLKREKALLESTIEELNKKLSCTTSLQKPEVNDAHVNTDEDWTNLHSVIVDRMSYDAEVEKNKKLSKTIEELRYNKQHLRTTIDKMQKALDKHSSKDRKELEAIKCELKSCKQELAEYKERCKELDEECETCAEYLRERDEQCRKLKEAKAALESKLQEYAESSPMAQSVRKKRQSLHDRRRGDSGSRADVSDAATDTPDDLVNYQAENASNATLMKDFERLKTVVQRVSAQKAELEEQLRAFTTLPVYVATGSAIVQKQQITDVLKENQKLKKINAKLITMCKKRGKTADANTENEDPSEIKT